MLCLSPAIGKGGQDLRTSSKVVLSVINLFFMVVFQLHAVEGTFSGCWFMISLEGQRKREKTSKREGGRDGIGGVV